MRRGAMLLLAVVSLCVGCKSEDKSESAAKERELPEVAGLEAIPATARVVLGANVTALAASPMARRALGRMLARDTGLEKRVDELVASCGLDPATTVSAVVIGMGPLGDRGADEAVMAVTGKLSEPRITACVGDVVQSSGGRLTTATVDGRSLYHADEGPGEAGVWFGFGGSESMVIATSKAALAAALGPGEKVSANRELLALIEKADTAATLWGAGAVDSRVGQGLVAATQGSAPPPKAMFGRVDLGEEGRSLSAELGVVMPSEKDAKSLVSQAKPQLAAASLVAQSEGLGWLVQKISVDSEQNSVYLRVSLSSDELREVLSQIDIGSGAEQNPAPESGEQGASGDVQGDAPADGKAPVRK